MKNLDLDRCWKLCKQMWKYVAGEVEAGNSFDVNKLKKIWLREHGFEGKRIAGTCFFCEYAEQIVKEFDTGHFGVCGVCPGRLADSTFSCTDYDHDFYDKPQAFYQEILRLDKIR